MKLSGIASAVIVATITMSCGMKDNYSPEKYLGEKEKEDFVAKVVRYTAKAPEGVGGAARLDKRFDNYYQEKAKAIKLERYYPATDTIFFMITQPAPSLAEKRHATGGILKFNEAGEVSYYEEVFRTWKMLPDTLINRTKVLFDNMVRGQSLEAYLTKNAGDRYIEFPDDKVFFDSNKREWAVKEYLDSVTVQH